MAERSLMELTDLSQLPRFEAVLVSVGGAPAPILKVLECHRPHHVWYFCSGDSRKIADQVHAQLAWHPDRDFIEVDRFEELAVCYRELRLRLPELLRKWKVAPEAVLVDYSGGTKAMSAALVLAATELFQQFSYVGGAQREKAGLGIVVDGKERVLYQSNPWSELAIREVERVRDLWNHGLFESAARVLEQTAPRVPRRALFETLASVAHGTAARHRLDFGQAEKRLGPAMKDVPKFYDRIADFGRCDRIADFGLLDFVQRSLSICQRCKAQEACVDLMREILDNALRTAKQSRYEDAAARLYRAMEMQAQLWLAEASNGSFVNGRLKQNAQVPATLAEWEPCRPDEEGAVKLSLELCFHAIHRLGDRRAEKVVNDLAFGKERSRWRQATEQRNSSILAHGVKYIGENGFNKMKEIAAEFLGFDLDHETNPIPDFDTRWVTSRS
jgi:CRISPR-associated protein (TIGR02710 family)